VACAVRTTADEMTRGLEEGFTLVLGGDSTIVIGALQGARTLLRVPVAIIYISATADLLTPETTTSGHLERMTLAIALGRGPEAVAKAVFPVAAVTPRHTVLLGVREWEASEKEAAEALALTIAAPAAQRRGMVACAAAAFEAVVGPVIVHFDASVVRPSEMPAGSRTPPGGLTLVEAGDLLRTMLTSSRVIALVVSGYNPAADADGACARKVVDLVASAMTRHGAF
jgi:arginase